VRHVLERRAQHLLAGAPEEARQLVVGLQEAAVGGQLRQADRGAGEDGRQPLAAAAQPLPGARALHRLPGSLGGVLDRGDVLVGPLPRGAGVDRQDRLQPARLDQRHVHEGRDRPRGERRRRLRRGRPRIGKHVAHRDRPPRPQVVQEGAVVRDLVPAGVGGDRPVVPVLRDVGEAAGGVDLAVRHLARAEVPGERLRRRRQRGDRVVDRPQDGVQRDAVAQARLPVLELALSPDGVGDLHHRHEHAAHAARVVGERAVGQVEPCGLVPAGPAQHEGLAVEAAPPAAEHRLVDRGVEVPDLGPALARPLAEGAGVPRAADRGVAVVVDLDEIGPPQHDHRERRGEDDIDRGPQAPRPSVRGPERRPRPVERAHQPAHLAPVDAGRRVPGRVAVHAADLRRSSVRARRCPLDNRIHRERTVSPTRNTPIGQRHT